MTPTPASAGERLFGDVSTASTSVVICTYTNDRFDDLREAILSLERQTVRPSEIVVAVDRNPELLARVRDTFPSVLAVENHHHPGAGGARNSGVEASSGEVVLFIDDDVQTEPTWLECLLPALSDPTALGAGGTIKPHWATRRPSWFPEEFDWVVGCTYRGMPKTIARMRNVISANMAVRREVFDALGGFRADFGKQGDASEPEETEFCIRALERWPSGSWLFVPRASVWHRVTPERETWRYFLTRCRNEGHGKASMKGHVPGDNALSTERSYTTRVLPLGVLRGVGQALRGDFDGLRRAAAIVTGFSLTAGTYLTDRGVARRKPRDTAEPIPGQAPAGYVGEVDVAEGIEPVPGVGRQVTVMLTVRLFTEPIGLLERDLPAAGLDAVTLAREVRAEFGNDLRERFEDAGLDWPDELPAEGVVPVRTPSFLAAREEALRSAPTMTVVVCTRDRTEDLSRSLQGLLAQAHTPERILVVDNAPRTQETKRLVEDLRKDHHHLDYVLEPVPGLSRARNRGIAECDTEVIAWFDDDAVCDRWWTAEVIRAFVDESGSEATSGPVVPMELATESQVRFEHFAGSRRGRGFKRAVLSAGMQSPLYPLPPFGAGLNMSFRRAALERIGGFDEALGAGTVTSAGEDTAAFSLILLGGGKIVYQPSALVSHRHRRDDDALRVVMLGYGRGLGAFYASMIANDPRNILEIFKLVGRALRDQFSPRSQRGVELADFPDYLLRLNRRGLLQGPFLYVLARSRVRRRIRAER